MLVYQRVYHFINCLYKLSSDSRSLHFIYQILSASRFHCNFNQRVHLLCLRRVKQQG